MVLKKKYKKYLIPIFNAEHDDILDFKLDPNAPEEIKKAYAEANRIAKETEDKIPFENWREDFG